MKSDITKNTNISRRVSSSVSIPSKKESEVTLLSKHQMNEEAAPGRRSPSQEILESFNISSSGEREGFDLYQSGGVLGFDEYLGDESGESSTTTSPRSQSLPGSASSSQSGSPTNSSSPEKQASDWDVKSKLKVEETVREVSSRLENEKGKERLKWNDATDVPADDYAEVIANCNRGKAYRKLEFSDEESEGSELSSSGELTSEISGFGKSVKSDTSTFLSILEPYFENQEGPEVTAAIINKIKEFPGEIDFFILDHLKSLHCQRRNANYGRVLENNRDPQLKAWFDRVKAATKKVEEAENQGLQATREAQLAHERLVYKELKGRYYYLTKEERRKIAAVLAALGVFRAKREMFYNLTQKELRVAIMELLPDLDEVYDDLYEASTHCKLDEDALEKQKPILEAIFEMQKKENIKELKEELEGELSALASNDKRILNKTNNRCVLF